MNTVIGQKYNRQLKLNGIFEEVATWYEENKDKSKYNTTLERNKTKGFELRQRDMENFIMQRKREYSKQTKEEAKLESAIKNNSGGLQNLISELIKDTDVQKMAQRILQMKKDRDSGLKSYIQNWGLTWIARAKQLFVGCLENIGTCLSIISFVVGTVSLLISYFLPTSAVATFVSKGSYLYQIVRTFIQGIFGWQQVFIREEAHKTLKKTYSAPTYAEMEKEKETWSGFANLWMKRITGRTVKVTTEEVITYTKVRELKSFLDLTLSVGIGLQPILGDEWTSLRALIQGAYYVSYASTALTFASAVGDCFKGNKSSCLSVAIRTTGLVLSGVLNSYMGDQEFDASSILALHIEGVFISEVFWFLAQKIVHKNIFPSLIGNERYIRLKRLSYVRTAVSVANLVNSAQKIIPIFTGDVLQDNKKMALLSAALLDRKIMNVWYSYAGDWHDVNLEQEKKKYDEKIENIRDAMKKVDKREDLIKECGNILNVQRKILDQNNYKITKERMDEFTRLSDSYQIAFCSGLFSFSYEECLQFEGKNLRDMDEKEQLKKILLFVSSYRILYGFLLKTIQVAITVIENTTKKDLDAMESRIRVTLDSLKRWTEQVSEEQEGGKPLKQSNSYKNLFSFVKDIISERHNIKNGDITSTKLEMEVERIKLSQKEALEKIELKTQQLQNDLTADVLDDLIATTEKYAPESDTLPVAIATPIKLKF
jgi:hypothetical protein